MNNYNRTKKQMKSNIRSKECDFGFSHIDDYSTSRECHNMNCPFYISDNDSGYYQYCIIGQLFDNLRIFRKGGK